MDCFYIIKIENYIFKDEIEFFLSKFVYIVWSDKRGDKDGMRRLNHIIQLAVWVAQIIASKIQIKQNHPATKLTFF